MRTFSSDCRIVGSTTLPEFTGLRVMMMPVILGRPETVPDMLGGWGRVLSDLWEMYPVHAGKTGYVTVDERELAPGATHRRPGLHVDGVYRAAAGGWGGGGGGIWGGGIGPDLPKNPARKAPRLPPGGGWGGGSDQGGPWASKSNGMLLVASHVGCEAWDQKFVGEPGPEGECEHLRSQCLSSARIVCQPGTVYWLSGLCVHESMPQAAPVRRQLLRLSMPSSAPWFEGYTENPLGVPPTGPILPRRDAFMDWAR